MKIFAKRDALLLVLAVHVAIDVFLISTVSIYDLYAMTLGMVVGYAMIVWPMSQGCLIAIWAANSRMRFSLRLPLALTGTVAALIALLGLWEFDVSGSDAPGFAFMLITQLAAILLLVNGGRLMRRQFRLWRSGWTEADARPTQFSLRQMLIWTAVLAFILGTGKALFGWLGWTADILVQGEFQICQILAVYNALYALLTLAPFTVRVRWPVRILLFSLAVAGSGALACSMPLVFACLSSFPQVVGIPISLMLAAPQVIYHTITLWPLWLFGYIGPRDDTASDPHETMPAPASPSVQ